MFNFSRKILNNKLVAPEIFEGCYQNFSVHSGMYLYSEYMYPYASELLKSSPLSDGENPKRYLRIFIYDIFTETMPFYKFTYKILIKYLSLFDNDYNSSYKIWLLISQTQRVTFSMVEKYPHRFVWSELQRNKNTALKVKDLMKSKKIRDAMIEKGASITLRQKYLYKPYV